MVSLLSAFKFINKAAPLNLKDLRYIHPSGNSVRMTGLIRMTPKLSSDTAVIQHAGNKLTGISETGLTRGIKHITGSSTGDTNALKPIIEECFVGIKSKEDAIKIFGKQFEEIAPDRAVYILNPSNLEKIERKCIGTSNSYMAELYRQASSKGTIIDRTNVSQMAEQIIRNGEKKVTIIVPDDFSGSGRSMIVNTAESLKDINIPEGVDIELVLSPMSATPFSKRALRMFSEHDTEGLMKSGALNKDKLQGKNSGNCINDSEIIRDFTEKYKDRMTIKPSEYIIEAKPYNETGAYLQLKETNPDAAQAIDILMTEHGKGYGRPGSCGTIVLVPGRNGVLKTPNNNCYGALPFVLSEGATICNIKNPNHKWSGKKWEVFVKKMAKELGVT